MDKLLLAATYYKLFLLNRDFHLLAGDSNRNTLHFLGISLFAQTKKMFEH